MRTRTAILAAIVAVLSLLAAQIAVASPKTSIVFDLTGAPIANQAPRGKLTYTKDHKGMHRLDVQVRRTDLPDGTMLDVFVDAVNAGQLVLHDSKGKLRLREKNGDTVPVVTESSAIEVKNGTTTVLANAPDRPRRFAMHARMSGAPVGGAISWGRASYREDDWGNTRRLSVHVRNINLPGATLDIEIDGVVVGSIILGPANDGKLSLKTEDGDTVTAMTGSSVLLVKNHADGSTLLTNAAWVIHPD